MTKDEAVEAIWGLSCGTLATLTGLRTYDQIDAYCRKLTFDLQSVDVTDCKNWVDLWEVLRGHEETIRL